MDRATLEKLIAQGEGFEVEFKVRLPSLVRLARTVCAFANSGGGVIIVGVDDQGHIVGLDAPAETRQAMHACLDHIEPRPDIAVEEIMLADARLVCCMVAKGENKPYQVVSPLGGQVFIRAGASIHPVAKARKLADEDAFRKRLRLTSLQNDVLKTIGSQDGIRLDKLCARHNLSRHRTMKMLMPLIRAGMVIEKDGGYILR